MSEWKTYKLEDAVDKLIDYRGKTPIKTTHGIPLITAKVIKNGRIETPNEFIAKNQYDKWMTRGIPEFGDVVLTTEAPLGEVAQIMTNEKIALAQRVITLRGKKNVIDSTYLKYFLFSPIGQSNLKAKETGSTVTGIKQSELRQVEIYAPDFLKQVEIAQILTSLDEKIELNLQMNQTLEAMAQALFKEWFVEFKFPDFDGELVDGLPKGWRMGELREALTIKYGKDHKHLEDGNIPVYGSGGIMRYANKALYEKESILIPRKGTLSNLFYLKQPFWSVDTMFYTIIKEAFFGKYLFLLLKSLNLASMNNGSAVPSLTTDILNNLEITIPLNEILIKFDNVVTPIYEKIESNILENQTLTTLRDSLIPQLMTGKIEVK
jgi:type I restriction enzyme, S subunit